MSASRRAIEQKHCGRPSLISMQHARQMLGRFTRHDSTREALEMGNPLFVIEQFIAVRAENRVGGEKGTGQRLVAAQLGVPPTMRHTDVSLFHRGLHREQGGDVSVFGFQPHPVSVRQPLGLRVGGVQEEFGLIVKKLN